MSEKDIASEEAQKESSEQPEDLGTGGSSINKGVLFGVLGAVGVVLLLLVGFVLLDPFGLVARLFGGGDPIAAHVSADVPMYLSVDLLKTQSEEVEELTAAFRDSELEEGEEAESMIDQLDKVFEEELDMNFSEDVLPWMGQYAGFVLEDLDFDIVYGAENVTYMIILEIRDEEAAAAFLEKYTAKREEIDDVSFEISEVDGATYYTLPAETEFDVDVVFTQVDGFVYMADSVETIQASTNLAKEDSLAASEAYDEIENYLPANRMMTFIMNGDAYFEMVSKMMDSLDPASAAMLEQIEGFGFGSAGFSLSAEEYGFQMDTVSIFNPDTASDYQKSLFSAEYLFPTTDSLVPDDTLIYLGANSPATSINTLVVEGSPFYTEEFEESMELFESTFGVNMLDLFELMSGEIGVAIGPADDGLFAEGVDVNMGFTILVGTDDEAGFDAWIDPLVSPLASDPMINLDEFQVGDSYNLQALSIYDSFADETITALVYGADNGFIVFGTSPGMLEDGFGDGPSLANNPLYQETWTYFPKGDIPYFYLDIQGLLSLIVESMDDYMLEVFQENVQSFTPMTVLAGTIARPAESVQTTTVILFIDTTTPDGE